MNDDMKPDWQSIGDWKNGRVRSGAKTMIWISLLFGLTFTGLGLPVSLQIPAEVASGNYIILVALLFPLVGISALILFVYSVLAWRKFGVTELVLDPAPGSIGGDFGAYVDIPIKWHTKQLVNITLNCQHLVTSGSGKNRSTKTTVVWQREGIATLSPGRNGTHCAFRFSIPGDLPESEKSSANYHQWLLQLDCEVPGIDFKRNFVVPVFASETPQFSRVRAEYAKQSAPLEKAPEGTVTITETAQGLQFYYPWYRHLWMGIMTLIFGMVFGSIGYFIGTNDGSFIFPVVFGGVGVLCIFIGLYVFGNTLTTRVHRHGINVVRNIYGIRFQRKVSKEDIVKIDRQIGSQMQGGSNYRVFYSIIAFTRDNRKITIADTLEGSRLADYIEQRIRTALEYDEQGSSLLEQ